MIEDNCYRVADSVGKSDWLDWDEALATYNCLKQLKIDAWMEKRTCYTERFSVEEIREKIERDNEDEE